jgi:lysophospholipase L1-like esterase
MRRLARFVCVVTTLLLVLPSIAPSPAHAAGPQQPPPPPQSTVTPPQIAPPTQAPPDPAEYAQIKERLDLYEKRLRDWPQFARYRDDNARLGAPAKGDRRVVFMGDSITDLWQRPQFGTFFSSRPSYVDRGISGQTTLQMLLRFQRDVIALQPAVVVILAGINDLAGTLLPRYATEIPDSVIEDELSSMAELAAAHNIRVVLSSLMPVSDYARVRKNDPRRFTVERPPVRILTINRWMKQYAADHGHVYVDYHSAMVDEVGLLKDAITDDGLHPNAAGYQVMAPLVEKGIAAALRR